MASFARSGFLQKNFSLSLLAVLLVGCSSTDPADDTGSSGTGGSSVVGDSTSTGGTLTTVGTGGSTAAGGTVSGVGGSSGGTLTSGGTGGASNTSFALSSANLTEGSAFADKYTCTAAGFNGSLSPALSWTPGPEGTKSYAITFIDVTLTQGEPPSDLGYHWVIYDIPASVLGLPEELKDASAVGGKQNGAYLGPCPNYGVGSDPNAELATHTYEFTVYALDTETLSLTQTTGTGAVKEAEQKLESSHLASTKLSGTSDAKP